MQWFALLALKDRLGDLDEPNYGLRILDTTAVFD